MYDNNEGILHTKFKIFDRCGLGNNINVKYITHHRLVDNIIVGRFHLPPFLVDYSTIMVNELHRASKHKNCDYLKIFIVYGRNERTKEKREQTK